MTERQRADAATVFDKTVAEVEGGWSEGPFTRAEIRRRSHSASLHVAGDTVADTESGLLQRPGGNPSGCGGATTSPGDASSVPVCPSFNAASSALRASFSVDRRLISTSLWKRCGMPTPSSQAFCFTGVLIASG